MKQEEIKSEHEPTLQELYHSTLRSPHLEFLCVSSSTTFSEHIKCIHTFERISSEA